MSKKSILSLTLCLGVFLIITACLAVGAPANQATNPATQAAATVLAAQSTAAAAITAAPEEAAPTAKPTEAPIPPTDPAPTDAPPTAQPTDTPPLPTASPVVRIAYVKDGNVYLWTEGSGLVGLTSSGDAWGVRISPDAAMIAYTRHHPADYYRQELWVVNTSGATNARVLVSADELAALRPEGIPGMGITQFAWRPGTHEVAYSTNPLFEGPGFVPNHDLRLVNADSLAKSVLFEPEQGGFFYYSPDGKQIALSNPQSISLVNADGSNLRRDVLTFPVVGTFSEYQYHPVPVWAADSGSLRVAIPPAETMNDPLPPTGLWRIPTDGTPAVLLGNIQAMPFAWPDNAFAPDLQHVLYAMMVGERTANINELRLANPDSSGALVYDSGESLNFNGWAPDSQHFMYTIYGGPRMGVYLGSIGQPAAIMASEPSSLRNITWVDNQRFAYFGQNGSSWELRISHPGGTNHAFIDTLSGDYTQMDVLMP